MKKCVVKISSKPEKIICAATLSTVLAIIFDGKKKKPQKQKNFVQRLSKNYKVLDELLSMIFFKDLKNAEKEKLEMKKKKAYKTKLRDLEIENAQYIDL